MPSHKPWLVLTSATVAWLTVSVMTWHIRKRMKPLHDQQSNTSYSAIRGNQVREPGRRQLRSRGLTGGALRRSRRSEPSG
jgi:hypothetical protein